MKPLKQLLTTTVQTTLKTEGFDTPAEVSVLLVEDDEIRGINREFRAKDSVTDVLSFPMLKMEYGRFLEEPGASDILDGRVLLGDIVISVPKALEQAQSYGHTPQRELAFLTVHGLLHLLGYDHEQPGQEETMTEKQEKILMELGLPRSE
jgi:probable rRNA maturation factor